MLVVKFILIYKQKSSMRDISEIFLKIYYLNFIDIILTLQCLVCFFVLSSYYCVCQSFKYIHLYLQLLNFANLMHCHLGIYIFFKRVHILKQCTVETSHCYKKFLIVKFNKRQPLFLNQYYFFILQLRSNRLVPLRLHSTNNVHDRSFSLFTCLSAL